MPSFYNRQPQGLPLTPPDYSGYGPSYFNGNQLPTMNYDQSKGVQEMFNMLNHHQQQQQHMGWGINQNQHMQDNSHRQQLHRAASFAVQPPPGLIHPNHTRFQSMDAGKPISLPPIKQMSSEQMFDEALQLSNLHLNPTQQKVASTKAEEKPVGGVSAFLDYEMDDMADFVASVATGIVLHGSTQAQAAAPFRKFVFQILSSTRLPSSTILLGLDYLSTRMNMRTMDTQKSSQLYKVLTIALLLASKFLDDNTFQNRSWAEVTGIQVTELNMLEADWLSAIGWNLHVDPTTNKGFNTWKTNWEAWLKAKQVSQSPPVLSPLVTVGNTRRHTMTTFSPVQQMYSPHHVQNMMQPQIPQNGFVGDRMRQPPQNHASNMGSNDFWWPNSAASAEYSPPSAPETGPATPEWNLGMNWASHCGPVPMHNMPRKQKHNFQQSRPLSHQPHQHYLTPPQQHHVWGPHCNCAACGGGYNMLGHHGFFLNQGQSVMG